MKKFLCVVLCCNSLLAQDTFEKYFQLKEEQNLQIQTHKLENPFLNYNFVAIQKLTIQALMLGKVKINDKWYKQGDTIHQAQITKIDTKEVTLNYDKIPIILYFKSDDKISIH
ncbi:transformation system protein [Campylobacter sp. MIT 21-1685]|uniref:transformation system protein n=1 Tax=unclassified Campylobacter TaxID=2593542 RepID=UPI00224AA60E|nr:MULTISPECIES: transformation system protein [unclassified Campylobacter]MCX2683249.1 transformation system protein [Campylobacter sp. MIT 21-1684]MCX2751558.1 transformation system protein [Campylobacter sp. MIT 21-1682]MCX2807757.1 transformation system protein [Campylobacter sp. MIT 21-1685]